MHRFVIALSVGILLAAGLPAAARASEDPAGTIEERFGALVERLLERLEPGLSELRELMGDMSGWHMPEVLPNGDILIRRRQPPLPPSEPPEVSEPFEL